MRCYTSILFLETFIWIYSKMKTIKSIDFSFLHTFKMSFIDTWLSSYIEIIFAHSASNMHVPRTISFTSHSIWNFQCIVNSHIYNAMIIKYDLNVFFHLLNCSDFNEVIAIVDENTSNGEINLQTSTTNNTIRDMCLLK